MPGADVSNCGHGEDVTTCADEKSHHNRAKKSGRRKSRMCFFGGFRRGFESGHEIGHNLESEQYRYEGGPAKGGAKIGRSPAHAADAQQNGEKEEHSPRCPILETSTQPNAAVIQHGEKNRKPDAQRQPRKEYGLSGDAVQFEGIQRWKDVRRKLADRHRFPRADDEICEQHHPTGEVAYKRRKHLGGIGCFSRRIRKTLYPLPIDVANGQQENSAQSETENRAKGAAAPEPVVHEYQPADANHRSKCQRKIIGQAELARERRHGFIMRPRFYTPSAFAPSVLMRR